MNLFHASPTSLKCYCYVPEHLYNVMKIGVEGSTTNLPVNGNSLSVCPDSEQSVCQPPTLFKRNKYTSVF